MANINRTKPQIFIPNEEIQSLTEVLRESHKHFDIYWFHWLNDGWLIMYGDYEPIIMIFRNGELCTLVTRRAWDYQSYFVEELASPPEVLFRTSFHHPYARVSGDTEEYESIKKDLISIQYEPKEIDPSNISNRFRVGEGHITKTPWKQVLDPRAYAEYIYTNYCIWDLSRR